MFLILVKSLRNIVAMFIEVLCLLCFETTKKVHSGVHFSVISRSFKALDGSNNRQYVPEINSEW